MTPLAQIQTRRIIFLAVMASAGAGVCNVLDKLTWQQARGVSHVFDIAALLLFWAAYISLWALLVVGPFRPRTEFSLRGDCGQRATNFFLALGGLVLLHLWGALSYAFL